MNPNPSLAYNPAALAVGPRGNVEILAVEWSVPSSRRPDQAYTVAIDPATQTLICACPDRQYRKRPCRHERSVLAGEHKPRIRVQIRPAAVPKSAPVPTPRLSADDLYGDADDRDALARRLAELRGAA